MGKALFYHLFPAIVLAVEAHTTMVKAPVGKPSFLISTAWTSKTIGPAQSEKILAAVFFGRKPMLKFEQVFGVILHN